MAAQHCVKRVPTIARNQRPFSAKTAEDIDAPRGQASINRKLILHDVVLVSEGACVPVIHHGPLNNVFRGEAIAFASFTQWIFNFFVVLLFPHFLASLGGAKTFIFLAFMSLLQWLFTYLYVPETKGLSLEEIEQLWN